MTRTRLDPHTCDRCGRLAEPTPAVLAAGGMHPGCRFGGALTASGAAAVDLDALALARWGIRRHGERKLRAQRRGRR